MPPWTTARYALKGAWLALIALAFAVVLALLAIQTVRIEGFKVWPLRVQGYRAENAELKGKVQSCAKRLGASNDSIDLLQQVIANRNAEIEARAAEYAAAKAQVAERQAALERAAVASDRRIARLREIATGAAEAGQCETPRELRELAEGL